MTYSWAECLTPRLKSLNIVENDKKITFRVGFKHNSRSSMFIHYIMLPTEKMNDGFKKNNYFYEIDGGPNSWQWRFSYPMDAYYNLKHEYNIGNIPKMVRI